MNKAHLIYWMWKFLEEHGMDKEVINTAASRQWRFNENPVEWETTVSQALQISYDEYKGLKQ